MLGGSGCRTSVSETGRTGLGSGVTVLRFRFLQVQHQMSQMIMTMPAIPPTTPPAIAPVCECFVDPLTAGELVGDGECVPKEDKEDDVMWEDVVVCRVVGEVVLVMLEEWVEEGVAVEEAATCRCKLDKLDGSAVAGRRKNDGCKQPYWQLFGTKQLFKKVRKLHYSRLEIRLVICLLLVIGTAVSSFRNQHDCEKHIPINATHPSRLQHSGSPLSVIKHGAKPFVDPHRPPFRGDPVGEASVPVDKVLMMNDPGFPRLRSLKFALRPEANPVDQFAG